MKSTIEKIDYDMSYKDLVMYYHTSLRNSITILALAMAVLSFVCTNKIKELKFLFITLLLVAEMFIGISIYNNTLMRKILFEFKKKDSRNSEINGLIIISSLFLFMEIILIISGLYILYITILK